MKFPNRMHRTVAITLLAASCLLAIAPVAEAGHARGRRYKGVVYASPAPHHHGQTVIVRQSGAGPVLAGLIGGFLIGTAVAHSAPVVVHEAAYVPAPSYRYWDPYCDEWFVSLSECREHNWNDRHPRVVKVFNGYRGECVRTLRWSNGAWYDCNDDRDWND